MGARLFLKTGVKGVIKQGGEERNTMEYNGVQWTIQWDENKRLLDGPAEKANRPEEAHGAFGKKQIPEPFSRIDEIQYPRGIDPLKWRVKNWRYSVTQEINQNELRTGLKMLLLSSCVPERPKTRGSGSVKWNFFAALSTGYETFPEQESPEEAGAWTFFLAVVLWIRPSRGIELKISCHCPALSRLTGIKKKRVGAKLEIYSWHYTKQLLKEKQNFAAHSLSFNIIFVFHKEEIFQTQLHAPQNICRATTWCCQKNIMRQRLLQHHGLPIISSETKK